MDELNEGGYPVKNAGYWRRKSIKCELENADLKEEVADLKEEVDLLQRVANEDHAEIDWLRREVERQALQQKSYSVPCTQL